MPYFLGSDILIGWQHRLVSIVCVMRRFSWADLVHFNLLFHIWFSRPFDWISSLHKSPIFSFVFSALVWSVLGAGTCLWLSSSGHPELSAGSFAGTASDESPGTTRDRLPPPGWSSVTRQSWRRPVERPRRSPDVHSWGACPNRTSGSQHHPQPCFHSTRLWRCPGTSLRWCVACCPFCRRTTCRSSPLLSRPSQFGLSCPPRE